MNAVDQAIEIGQYTSNLLDDGAPTNLVVDALLVEEDAWLIAGYKHAANDCRYHAICTLFDYKHTLECLWGR